MTTTFGRRIQRVEDAALVAGAGRFLDDIEIAGTLHLTIARSSAASADISVDVSAAEALAGVVRVVTYEDVADLRWDHVLPVLPQRSALADGRVRFHGEPIAAVLADDLYAAFDARDAVWVDYEFRPAVVTVEAAMAPHAPLVYDELGTNVAYRSAGEAVVDLFDGAEVVVERTFRNHRIAPGMLEGRGILAIPDGDGLTVFCSHQMPHALRDRLAVSLGVDPDAIRVIAPDVGGGFGAKATFYPEYPLAARLALELGRPIKYVETRSENLLVASHGRSQTTTVTLGATAHGELVGMRFRSIGEFGAAIDNQRWCLRLTEMMMSGAYSIPRIEYELLGVLTNTAPVGAFRGAGRPEAAFAVERAMDYLARELKIDPADVRRGNFLRPEAFPYITGNGSTYDSGNYGVALDHAIQRIDYEGLRREQSRRRANDETPLLGIGVASYVELTGGGEEYGDVTISHSGDVTVRTGTSPHGQGHRTTWAQIAADKLGVPMESITVIHGDTGAVPRGGGTAGSRSAPLGGSAVGVASDQAAQRLRQLAADALEAAPIDIRLKDGRAVVAGTDVGMDIVDLVALLGEPLVETAVFESPGLVYPFGTHACAVEIDPESGAVTLLAYVAVDDCGPVINPMITEGQVHGGVLQGVAHALKEEIRYDDDGNLLTGNWLTYQIPTMGEGVAIEAVRTETPSPNNPLGVKGIGEAGATGSTPAVANAVMDALTAVGIDEPDLAMPYTASKVWAVLRDAGVHP